MSTKSNYPEEYVISIIIPVFNRELLIGETLNSLLNQTYSFWECIVVDDGSNDSTVELIEGFEKKDNRIKLFKRPSNYRKGANSCRNFGFQKSKGSFIIWFDSDDLMTPEHLERKVEAIITSEADFVIAQTANFKDGVLLEPYKYEKKPYGIKASDFLLSKIHWYTYDVILTRELAEKIEWNVQMKSWQDYNYFCKMLLISENGKYLEETLTHRRLHSISIQSNLTRSKDIFLKEMLENRLLTFTDVKDQIDLYTTRELIYDMMNISFGIASLKKASKNILHVYQLVLQYFGLTSSAFFLASLNSAYLTSKGQTLLEKAKKRKSFLLN